MDKSVATSIGLPQLPLLFVIHTAALARVSRQDPTVDSNARRIRGRKETCQLLGGT